MACNSTVEKNHRSISPENVDKKSNHEDPSSSCSDNHDRSPVLKQKKGTFRSTDLFQKNVSGNKFKQKRKDESASTSKVRTQSIPLIPPASAGGFPRVSFLERSLFARVKLDAVLPAPSPTEESKTAHLTIFYAVVINVYDDVQ